MVTLVGRPLLYRLAVNLEDISRTVDGVSMRGMMVEEAMEIRPKSSVRKGKGGVVSLDGYILGSLLWVLIG